MASPLVPEGVLLSVGDFAFIQQLMQMDGIIDEAIGELRASNFDNYREVCTTVHRRISTVEDGQTRAEAKAAPEGSADDSAPTLPLPKNHVYYIFTEIFREGVAKAPTQLLQNRCEIGDYILGQATGAIRDWINENLDEDFLPKQRATSIMKEIFDIYRHYQVTGDQAPDWSNRDACLAMLGLEPTDEFLMLSAFTTAQEAIIDKFISIGRNYEVQHHPPSPGSPQRPVQMQLRPPQEEDEDDDYDDNYDYDDDDDDTEILDLMGYPEESFEEEEEVIEEPRYHRRSARLSRRQDSYSLPD